VTGPTLGSHARWFAEKVGWPLDRYTLLVEGNHDERHLRLANRLYCATYHRRLITEGMIVVAAGDGPDGGCRRIQQDFKYVFRAITEDLGPDLQPLFRLVAIVDDDPSGRGAFSHLIDERLDCQGWRDVFKLKRVYPMGTRLPGQLKVLIERANEPFKGLDCEIEDLFSQSFLEAFKDASPGSCTNEPRIVASGHHYELSRDGKSRLLRFAEENAMLDDVTGLIHLLRAIRYYLGLNPDGD
jgi:hypothetical protein